MELERAKFIATVDTRLVAPDGSMCMNFQAGQTREVPKLLYPQAIAAGLMPEQADSITAESIAVPAPPRSMTQTQTIEEGLVEACKTLVARGRPEDFTVNVGLPRVPSLKKLVDFDFTARQAREAFERAMFEVNKDDDDSTEHPESGGSVTE